MKTTRVLIQPADSMERPQKLKQDLFKCLSSDLKKNGICARLPNENTIKKMMDPMKSCP
jgi:hypothetical protein